MKDIIEGIASRFRIHIPVGTVLLTMAVLFGSFAVAHGADLLFAEGGHWHSTFYFVSQSNATAPVTVSATNCSGFGPLPSAKLNPGGVVKLSPFICGADAFGTLPVPDGVSSRAELRYDDGTNKAAFTLRESLDPFRKSQPTYFDNSEGRGTWVTILCSAGTPLTAVVYDPNDPSTYTFEYFECAPPATVYGIKSQGLGTFSIQIGYAALMDAPNAPPIRALVTRTDALGFGNGEAEALRP